MPTVSIVSKTGSIAGGGFVTGGSLSVVYTTSLGQQGVPYSGGLVATGGVQPYTFTISSGSLPPGLTLTATGYVSGTPTSSGVFAFTGKVVDHAGNQATVATSVTIAPSTVPLSDLTSVTAQEVTGSRYLYPDQSTHTRIQINATWNATTSVQNMTVWLYYNWTQGQGWYWLGVQQVVVSAGASLSYVDIDLLAGASVNAQIAVQAGSAQGDGSVKLSSLPSGAVVQTSPTNFPLVLAAPIVAGATATITDPSGGTPTPSSIYMGTNGIGNPYWAANINVTTPDGFVGTGDPNTYFYWAWVEWADASGTPITPGGVPNPPGWQPGQEFPNDGTTKTWQLLGNYPANGIDGYLAISIWGFSRNSTASQAPFTGDSNVVLQNAWPSGGPGTVSKYLLHVGPPPSSLDLSMSKAGTYSHSLYVDPTTGLGTSNSDNPLNLFTNSLFDQGSNAWSVFQGSWTQVIEPPTGGTPPSSLSKYVGKLAPDGTGTVYIYQRFATKPGKSYYLHSLYRVTALGGNVVLYVIWMDNTGTQLSGSTGSQYVSVPTTAGWQQVVSMTTNQAPAGAAYAQFMIGAVGMPAGSFIEYDTPSVNEQVPAGDGTTPNGSGGLAMNLASNSGLQFISGQASVNFAGSNLTVNGSGGLDINSVPLIKLQAGNTPPGFNYVGNIAAANILTGYLAAGVIYTGTINATQINVGTLNGFTLNSVTVNSGSITISTAGGSANIGVSSTGLTVTAGSNTSSFSSGGVSVNDGYRTTSMSASAMTICGVSCFSVGNPGQFQGNGVYCPSYNITGATITGGAFVAAGYTGGTFTFYDQAGALHTVKCGLLIS